MRLRHYYRWLTSKEHRTHYWLRQHLRGHRFVWALVPSVFALIGYDLERLKVLRAGVVEGKKGNRMRKVLSKLIEFMEKTE